MSPADVPETFETEQLRFRYPGSARDTVSGVSLRVPRGSVYAVLGPNGAGKSTLLKLLMGIRRPDAGEILVEGRPLARWKRRELARAVGVVPQIESTGFPVTVREVVAMGRYPHLGLWRAEGARDREAIGRAMERCAVHDLAFRPLDSLSGGERQRVRIARALAQEPRAMVLDEPTASLDVRFEMEIFELVAGLARADGVTILLVTHNLNLAARYADRLLLLDEGRTAAEGTPAQVLVRERLERVYRWPVTVGKHPGPGPDEGAPQVVPLALRRGELPPA